MSGLRAISPAVNPPDNQYVKNILTVCAMHSIPCGTPSNLAAFLKALDTDKHLAMEFWSIVARCSGENTNLSIPALNGTVLEVVMQAVTGCSVAEMIAAGRESRRLVGDLGGLLAGEDLNSPIAGPIVEAEAPLAFSPDAGPHPILPDNKVAEVERLRADVELLREVFGARFGGERTSDAAPSRGSQRDHRETVPIEPQQVRQDGEVIRPVILHDVSPVNPPATEAPSARPAASARPISHTVYAEAKALSSGQRTAWEEPASIPLPPPTPSVPTLREVLPDRASVEACLTPTDAASLSARTFGEVTTQPPIIALAEPKPDPLATWTLSLGQQRMFRRVQPHRNKSGRLILEIALLLLLLVGIALVAQWWIQSRTIGSSEPPDGSRTTPAASTYPVSSATPSGAGRGLTPNAPAAPVHPLLTAP